MTDKLEALSQPVAYDYQMAGACIADGDAAKWVDWEVKLTREYPPGWMIEDGKVKDLKPRYSQEYVTALLEELRIAKGDRDKNGWYVHECSRLQNILELNGVKYE
ncbi:hypothetical protein ABQ333_04860 [Serratia fonticola]|uniref:hypothetical protein n=1 Tax=Serratia fonticola TaxID=47917 RepID=UPI003AABF3A0